MARITNAVLAEKIDNIATEISELKIDVKFNSTFRLQFKAIITTIAGIAGTIGGIIAVMISKIWSGKWVCIIHICDSGNKALDQEDEIKLDSKNWNMLGAANSLSNRAKVEGLDLDNLSPRGVSADTHRAIQHEEYIDNLGGK